MLLTLPAAQQLPTVATLLAGDRMPPQPEKVRGFLSQKPRGARPVCGAEGMGKPGAQQAFILSSSVRAVFISKPFSVLEASQLGPGPGSH